MPRPEPTEIVLDKSGNETHESWLLVSAHRVTSSPGAHLFDSEIQHAHYISVQIARCSRQRELHKDWLFERQVLLTFDLSEAQWGAFVSSFGTSGVPATLSRLAGALVPGVATDDSRLSKSHEEVRNKATEGMEKVKAAHKRVQEAFDQKLGIKETRWRLRDLDIAIQHMPSNMEFAAKSLAEATENVVQKARSDIEAMARQAAAQGRGLTGAEVGRFELAGPEIAE